jgi:hypothetical protein
MLTDDDLREMAATAEKARSRNHVCCLLHADCSDNVTTLVREVRRLRKIDQAVTDALILLSKKASETD